MSSEGQTEQTDFGSYRPRVRRGKLVLVHVIRGSDGANWFWFISSEGQTEQTGIGSYRPRVGQKKRVLVCPVDQVDSFNKFWFTPSPESIVSMSFGLLRRPGR